MTFPVKNWQNLPLQTTPINAEAMEDMEGRLSDYTDEALGVLHPAVYGAVGDGTTNDTAAFTAMLADLNDRGTVELEAGKTYKVDNISIPNKEKITFRFNGARIVSSGSGTSTYLIAPANWIANTATAHGQSVQFLGPGEIKANTGTTITGGKDYAIVGMSPRFRVDNLEIQLAAKAGVLLTSQTANGTDLSTSVVENRVTNCRIHDCGEYNVRVNDPTDYRVTDGFLLNNELFNAGLDNIRIDKGSGWLVQGNHTYQYTNGSGADTAFTSASNWDLRVVDVGDALRVVNNEFESGCVYLKALTLDHVPIFNDNDLGETAVTNALFRVDSTVSGGNNAYADFQGNKFQGPSSGNYVNLYFVGPSSGDPMVIKLTGGRLGFRNGIVWSQQVQVITENLSVYQGSQNMPPDLLADGLVLTSGARPRGVMHRSASPSGVDTYAYVVGDRVRDLATGREWVCTAAGTPGTWGLISGGTPYRRIASGYTRFDAQATGTLGLTENATQSFGGASGGKAAFYIDPADYAATGLTTYFRLRLTVLTNDTAPTSTFTVTLVPITAPAGAAANVSVTAGTAVSNSSAAVAAPAVNTLTKTDSSDFTISSAGFYAISHVISVANMAAGSSAAVRAELFVRNA